MEHIGKKLKEFRDNKDLTQSDVANSMGMTRENVYYIEKNPRPSIDNIKNYANAIGVAFYIVLNNDVTHV